MINESNENKKKKKYELNKKYWIIIKIVIKNTIFFYNHEFKILNLQYFIDWQILFEIEIYEYALEILKLKKMCSEQIHKNNISYFFNMFYLNRWSFFNLFLLLFIKMSVRFNSLE